MTRELDRHDVFRRRAMIDDQSVLHSENLGADFMKNGRESTRKGETTQSGFYG